MKQPIRPKRKGYTLPKCFRDMYNKFWDLEGVENVGVRDIMDRGSNAKKGVYFQRYDETTSTYRIRIVEIKGTLYLFIRAKKGEEGRVRKSIEGMIN